MDLVATEHRCSKRAEEPGVAQARHEMQATLQHFFTKTANAIAATIRDHQKVAKASGADSLMASCPESTGKVLVPSLAINLKKISKAGAARAISQPEHRRVAHDLGHQRGGRGLGRAARRGDGGYAVAAERPAGAECRRTVEHQRQDAG